MSTKDKIKYTLIRLLIFVTLSFVFVPSGNLRAEDIKFNMEKNFSKPVHIPPDIIKKVSKEFSDFELSSCSDDHEKLEQLLEATYIPLRPSGKNTILVVKPAVPCLCAVYTCHYWLFELRKKAFVLIGEMDAHTIELNHKVNKGYRNIKTFSGTAGWTHKSTYIFNGKRYVQRYLKTWNWQDDEKQ
jgi:hypothetical protein